MALLDAEEIYISARHAGFSPSQAVTMTAIALAESGGETVAYNPDGEDSWGLWQINLRVHTDLVSLGDARDPLVNARMAYIVSQEGTDIRPWTVTHGGDDGDARYLQFRQEAERAHHAVEPGIAAPGAWDPPVSYRHPVAVAAGDPVDVALVPPPTLPLHLQGDGDEFLLSAVSQVGNQVLPSEATATDVFLQKALAQQDDSYVFGAEVDLNDVDPDTFDCSELVEWAAAQAGVQVPDGSWVQYQTVRSGGGEMTVEQALQTPGALLFRFGSDPLAGGRPAGAHVAISLGDGRTIEARGSAYGVGVWDAGHTNWTHAGVLTGLSSPTMVPSVVGPVERGADTDGDRILNEVEVAIGTNPFRADSDGDGFVDSVELLEYRTDPRSQADNPRDISLREAGLPEAPAVEVPDPVPVTVIEPPAITPDGTPNVVAVPGVESESDAEAPPAPVVSEDADRTGDDGGSADSATAPLVIGVDEGSGSGSGGGAPADGGPVGVGDGADPDGVPVATEPPVEESADGTTGGTVIGGPPVAESGRVVTAEVVEDETDDAAAGEPDGGGAGLDGAETGDGGGEGDGWVELEAEPIVLELDDVGDLLDPGLVTPDLSIPEPEVDTDLGGLGGESDQSLP